VRGEARTSLGELVAREGEVPQGAARGSEQVRERRGARVAHLRLAEVELGQRGRGRGRQRLTERHHSRIPKRIPRERQPLQRAVVPERARERARAVRAAALEVELELLQHRVCPEPRRDRREPGIPKCFVAHREAPQPGVVREHRPKSGRCGGAQGVPAGLQLREGSVAVQRLAELHPIGLHHSSVPQHLHRVIVSSS
jgi:hypothetical protein